MTLKELRNTVEQNNKGLAYRLYKQAILVGLSFSGKKFPDKLEKACPELMPPRKTYKMPEWMKKRYLKQRGVKLNE